MGGSSPADRQPRDDPGRRLRVAPLEVVGRFTAASNATLLVRLGDRDPRPVETIVSEQGLDLTADPGLSADLAVYKPQRGEVPLWDFPAGTLHRREVAAYEVAVALGWGLVPPTVLRADAPFGVGSVQRYVPHDPERHYFRLLEEGDAEVRRQLVAMVLFDLVIDNADRKGGHVLLATDAPGPRVQLVDHGLSFNVARKLRTVAWDLAGEHVPGGLRADLDRFREALAGELGARLTGLVSPAEVEVLEARTCAVLELDVLPDPTGPFPYPWPLI